jgi:hypothetical protein
MLSKLLVYFTGYLIAIFAGSPLVLAVLSKLKLTEEQKAQTLDKSAKGAGKLIGMLERALTLTFMYLKVPEAVPMIFVAKSIIRFDYSKERYLAEYYLAGTLCSITFAVIVGIIINYIVA